EDVVAGQGSRALQRDVEDPVTNPLVLVGLGEVQPDGVDAVGHRQAVVQRVTGAIVGVSVRLVDGRRGRVGHAAGVHRAGKRVGTAVGTKLVRPEVVHAAAASIHQGHGAL